MDMIKEVKEAIKGCPDRINIYDVDMCTNKLTWTPCLKRIDDGECPCIKDLLNEDKEKK